MNFKKTLSIIFISIVFASSLFSMGDQSDLSRTCNSVMKDELAYSCAKAVVPVKGIWFKLGYCSKVRDVFANPNARTVSEIEGRIKGKLEEFYAEIDGGYPRINKLLFVILPAIADANGRRTYTDRLNEIANMSFEALGDVQIDGTAKVNLLTRRDPRNQAEEDYIKMVLVAEFKKITHNQIKKFIEARSANPSLLKPVNVARVAVAAGTVYVMYYTWGTIVACYHSAYPQDHELTDQMQTQLGMLFASGAEFFMEKVAPKAVCFYDGWFYAKTAALTSLAVGGITFVVKQPARLINWAGGFESTESDVYLLA